MWPDLRINVLGLSLLSCWCLLGEPNAQMHMGYMKLSSTKPAEDVECFGRGWKAEQAVQFSWSSFAASVWVVRGLCKPMNFVFSTLVQQNQQLSSQILRKFFPISGFLRWHQITIPYPRGWLTWQQGVAFPDPCRYKRKRKKLATFVPPPWTQILLNYVNNIKNNVTWQN